MGLSSRFPVHAWHRHGAGGRHDRRKAPQRGRQGARSGPGLTGLVCLWLWWLAGPAGAEALRIALYHAELSRDGPGLLLADIGKDDPQVAAVVQVIDRAGADVLVLAGVDHDAGGAALAALNARLARPYPHLLALQPNSGVPTGIDLDGDGQAGGPRDAQGYGRFPGQGAMAVLSRWPIGAPVDLSGLLWRDLPGAPALPPQVAAVQRLSSVGHWIVPVQAPGGDLAVLAWHATPPLFQPVNVPRNADETRLWTWLMDGLLPVPAPAGDVVLAGIANVDPADGAGDRAALAALLADPRLQDPRPRSARSGSDAGQTGDPATDTAAFDSAGGLRLGYVLPGAGLRVSASGVIWPADGDAFLPVVQAASRHRLVWVDLLQD